jgi:hypothetical protein
MSTTEIPPLDVNIVSGTLNVGTKRPKECRASHKTAVLTAANPTYQVVGYDPARDEVYVNVLDNSIVVTSSNGQASDLANTTGTLTAPNGRLLGVSNGSEYCIKGQNEVWFSAATYPTRVGFTVIREI